MPEQRPLRVNVDVSRQSAFSRKAAPPPSSDRVATSPKLSSSACFLAWLEKIISLALAAIVIYALHSGCLLTSSQPAGFDAESSSSHATGSISRALLTSWQNWGVASSTFLSLITIFTLISALVLDFFRAPGEASLYLGAVAPVLLFSSISAALGEPTTSLGALFPSASGAFFSPGAFPVALSGAVMPSYSVPAVTLHASGAVTDAATVGVRIFTAAVALASFFISLVASKLVSLRASLTCATGLAAIACAALSNGAALGTIAPTSATASSVLGVFGSVVFLFPAAVPVAVFSVVVVALCLWALLRQVAPQSLAGSEAVAISLLSAPPLWLSFSAAVEYAGALGLPLKVASLVPLLVPVSLPPLRASLAVAAAGSVFAALVVGASRTFGLPLLPAAVRAPEGERAQAGRSVFIGAALSVLPVCYSMVWLCLGHEPVAWLVSFLLAPAPALAPLAEALGAVAGCASGTGTQCGTVGALVIAAAVAPRMWLLGFCLVVAGAGVFIALANSSSAVPVTANVACDPSAGVSCGPARRGGFALTVIRKGYHLLAVVVLAPPILLDLGFASLALSGAFAIFLIAESIRGPRLPPLGSALHRFASSFIDERDSGELILTHIYLLVGCSIPVWVATSLLPPPLAPPAPALAPSPLSGPAAGPWLPTIVTAWRALGLVTPHDGPGIGANLLCVPSLWPAAAAVAIEPWWAPEVPASGAVASLAGLIVLGIGDSAASIVGTIVGGQRWPGSKKTLSGTAAAAIATVAVVVVAMEVLGRGGAASPLALISDARLWAAAALGVVVALAEAATEHIDNLFLPVLFLTGIAAVLPGAIGEAT